MGGVFAAYLDIGFDPALVSAVPLILDSLNLATNAGLWIVAAAICGAALGSKVVFLLIDPAATLAAWNTSPVTLMAGGRTIVQS